jgi:hypothetical protein
MPISVVCPGCSAKLNAPDAAAGKKVKCPKCQGAIVVPAAAAQFEVVEDEPAPPAKKPVAAAPARPRVKAEVEADGKEEDARPRKKPVKAAADEDDEEDEKPRKKAKVVAEDDEEERKPRKKKRDEEEDEDERPRKKKKKKGGGTSVARTVIGALVLVILLGVAGAIYYVKFFSNDDETASKPPENAGPPAGPKGGPPGGFPGPKLPGPGLPPGPGGNPMPNPGGEKLKFQAADIGTPHWTEDGKIILAPYITKDRFQAFGVWDRQTGDPLLLLPVQQNKLFFSSIASGISPDRKQVVIVSESANSLTLWKVSDGSLEKTIDLPKAPVSGASPAFATYTPDGKAVVAAYEKSLLRVDLGTGTVTSLLKDVEIREVSYCASKNISAASNLLPNGDHELRVTDLNQPETSFAFPHKEDERLRGRPFISADGSTVAAYIEDRTSPAKPKHLVYLYDVATKQLKARVPMPVESEEPSRVPLSLSADGKRVLCGYSTLMPGGKTSGKCWCYDLPSKALRQIGLDFDKFFQPLSITADGKTVGIWLAKVLQLYDAETGRRIAP